MFTPTRVFRVLVLVQRKAKLHSSCVFGGCASYTHRFRIGGYGRFKMPIVDFFSMQDEIRISLLSIVIMIVYIMISLLLIVFIFYYNSCYDTILIVCLCVQDSLSLCLCDTILLIFLCVFVTLFYTTNFEPYISQRIAFWLKP